MDRQHLPTRNQTVGVLASLSAALCFALAALLVKVCSTGFSTLDVLWGRAVLQGVFLGAVFAWERSSPWGPRELRGWLALRGLLGVGSIVGYFVGIIALPLADSISLYSVKPVFAAILGACFLHESLRCVHGAATLLAAAGCVLIAQTDRKEASPAGAYLNHVVAVAVVIVSALLAASTSVVTRRIMSSSQVRAEIPVWYFCVADVIILGALTPVLRGSAFSTRPPQWSWWHWLALVGVSLFSILGQQGMTLGLRYIPSALGTLLVQSETAIVFVLHIAIYGSVSLQSLVGACLICVATAGLTYAELRAQAALPHNREDIALGTAIPGPCRLPAPPPDELPEEQKPLDV